ncbi:MAG: UDP-2,3-diacylglucosamine diphosphatase LpxI [Desulfobacterales bacterium]|nr:UDP-2,3-diacylglucosamine diphosphatase LpxI [Desulfobacterales bacterium]
MLDKDVKILGLIAGQGRLPFLVAHGARTAGLKVICVGLGDNPEPSLAQEVDTFYTVGLARPGQWIRKLRRHNVTHTIMVGRVAKSRLHSPWRIIKYLPDWRGLRIYYSRVKNKGIQTDIFLGALADELATGGIILEDSTMYCQEHLAHAGVMTKVQPNAEAQADIQYGWDIAKKLGELDIGQAVIVKEKEVIAVEGIEGTAEMIKRAGQHCRRGNWTLIKTAKPNQDMRFDVPCVGTDTIEGIKANGGKNLVVEAGKTIIIDKPDTLALANKLGIAIIGC